jgi:hypothetical protein
MADETEETWTVLTDDDVKAIRQKFAEGFGYGLADVEAADAPTGFDAIVYELFDDAADLLLSKHHDYGPHNIGRSPGGPLNGLRVRLWDKLARLNNLVDSGVEAKHESLEDTLIDMANYALIGVLVCRGQWPSD